VCVCVCVYVCVLCVVYVPLSSALRVIVRSVGEEADLETGAAWPAVRGPGVRRDDPHGEDRGQRSYCVSCLAPIISSHLVLPWTVCYEVSASGCGRARALPGAQGQVGGWVDAYLAVADMCCVVM
jgi:hypothetical protein